MTFFPVYSDADHERLERVKPGQALLCTRYSPVRENGEMIFRNFHYGAITRRILVCSRCGEAPDFVSFLRHHLMDSP